jgi:hypothetical protein
MAVNVRQEESGDFRGKLRRKGTIRVSQWNPRWPNAEVHEIEDAEK